MNQPVFYLLCQVLLKLLRWVVCVTGTFQEPCVLDMFDLALDSIIANSYEFCVEELFVDLICVLLIYDSVAVEHADGYAADSRDKA